MARTTGALSATLSLLLPDQIGILLLQSCLGTGEECGKAWAAFQQQERGLTELFRTDRGELKRLGPLLLDNLRRNGIEIEARLATVLRTGTLREELRSRICRSVLEEVLAVLTSLGAESILLGGAALAEWAYPMAWLRHSHDIDLLVAEADRARIAGALTAAQFSPVEPAEGRDDALVVTHRTSLPIRLCGSMYEVAPGAGSVTSVRHWSRELQMGDARTRVLAPEAALAYALARAAFSPRRASLQWACDAWMICAGAEPLRPEVLLEALKPSRLLLPASIMLGFLGRIGAPVAPELIDAVADAAASVTPLERDLALFGLRRGVPGGARELIQSVPDSRTRLALLRWLCFPSAAYLRWSRPAEDRVPAPALYLVRAAAALGDFARGRLRSRHSGVAAPHVELGGPNV